MEENQNLQARFSRISGNLMTVSRTLKSSVDAFRELHGRIEGRVPKVPGKRFDKLK